MTWLNETGRHISLVTFRKNGQAVPTPGAFVVDGEELFVLTARNSGKVKRGSVDRRSSRRVATGSPDHETPDHCSCHASLRN
ncbi:hypothetical protein Misp01_79160 [Microtetraspora sp. NBRC 13810]|uniref:hypothetical protein n=1 Tax=Microtetraspora sp. NBRC 13810 TaxID=3030990 RepID=UPI0024A4613F|nr:hypothetical protein [Microtetraspora sp. NBRC 13810]GLW12788.1 hypothetical protein Misp01_79160 [Microtetraspora sp. NBRC 13810]